MKSATVLTMTFLLTTALWALDPKREYDITPDQFGMDYEEVEIQTDDGLKLYGWFFKPAESSDKCIIISHNGAGNMADNLRIISQFISLGYHVVSYDYRGYGKSADFDINKQFFIYPQFYKDISAVVNHMGKYHAKLQLDLYGIGIGGALSIGAAANHKTIRRVIADSPYLTFDLIKERLEAVEGKAVMTPMGYNKFEMEPLYAVEKTSHVSGILYIVGKNDRVVTTDDIKTLRKKARRKSEVYEVKEATNDKNFSTDRNQYFAEIQDFLDNY